VSETGDRISALETIVRTALGDLPAGADGWTRGPGIGEHQENLPHVYAHEPIDLRTELDWRQYALEWTIALDLWVREETQEELCVRVAAIVAGIHADPTLGGEVDDAFVSNNWIKEFPGKAERLAVLVVEARRVE
jgi:hypothetical protein